MSEKSKYLIYLIEQYALTHSMNGAAVFKMFKDKNLLPYIDSMYFSYHTEKVANAINDIDNKLKA